jgi:hypothetical protein
MFNWFKKKAKEPIVEPVHEPAPMVECTPPVPEKDLVDEYLSQRPPIDYAAYMARGMMYGLPNRNYVITDRSGFRTEYNIMTGETRTVSITPTPYSRGMDRELQR